MPSVSDVMSRDVLAVESAMSVVEVARAMVSRNVGAVVVVDGGRLAGIMTERDLMRAVAGGAIDGKVVGDCMTRNPETIEPDAATEYAGVLMIHGGFRHLPVTDGDDVVGMVSIRDLIPANLDDSAPRGV